MKLKIALVGPAGCGKTFAANILASHEGSTVDGVKPPYRPTHSVRIVEFNLDSLQLGKYSLEVGIQLWEVGDNPAIKGIYPAVQYGLDGVIVMYDVGKEASVREASSFFMNFVTHAPTGLAPNQALLIGNKFRGSAEHGPQRVVGVPPRMQHIAINIEDDPQRLREEVNTFVARVAQLAMDQQQKANFMG